MSETEAIGNPHYVSVIHVRALHALTCSHVTVQGLKIWQIERNESKIISGTVMSVTLVRSSA